MDARQFLSEFGHIMSAPGGVPRLREMILLLATSGRLVSGIATASPPHILLNEIEFQREVVNESLSSRRARLHYSPNTPVELFINAPLHWARAHLGEVGRIIGGGTPPKEEPAYFTADESGIVWLTPADLYGNKEKYVYSSQRRLTNKGLENSSAQIVPRGTVLFSSRAPIGYVAIAGCDLATNQGFKSVAPYVTEMSEFIHLYLRAIVPFVEKHASGTTFKEVSGRVVSALPIAFPGLDEQKRIVAKVDELLALCDKLEAQQQDRETLSKLTRSTVLNALESGNSADELNKAWHRVQSAFRLLFNEPNSTKSLNNTIARLAIRGKLTTQSGDDQVEVDEFLTVVQKKKAALIKKGLIQRERPAARITDRELPFSLPLGWRWCRLNEVSICRDGQRIPVSKSERELRRGGYPYYGASGVIDSIDDYIFDEPLLLVGEDGANLLNRSTPIAFLATGKYWVNNHAHVLDSANEVALRYLSIFINAIDLKPYVTGTAQPKMNQQKMNSIVVALPPPKEQARIVRIVDRLVSRCDDLFIQLEQAHKDAGKLTVASIAAITGIRIEDKEKMKVPKTELVSTLRIGVNPMNKEHAPLASILVRHQGELPAKTLFGSSGLEIDAFYQQLKTEMLKGWIVQPEVAYVKEVEAS